MLSRRADVDAGRAGGDPRERLGVEQVVSAGPSTPPTEPDDASQKVLLFRRQRAGRSEDSEQAVQKAASRQFRRQ